MLQIGEGDKRHECVSVQAGPGAALEVIEPELLLELLVPLLANPAGLDGCREPLERRVHLQVGEIVLPLPRRAPLANKPEFPPEAFAGWRARAGAWPARPFANPPRGEPRPE